MPIATHGEAAKRFACVLRTHVSLRYGMVWQPRPLLLSLPRGSLLACRLSSSRCYLQLTASRAMFHDCVHSGNLYEMAGS